MNNRYICKAKRKDNNEWVEGYLIQGNKTYIVTTEAINYMVVSTSYMASIELVEVISETVGQYTGLEDKNGRRIFEGDVVYCKSRLNNANMVVIFECGQFRMILSENYRNYQTNSGFYNINCFDKEVIGNIYDNPELLKGE